MPQSPLTAESVAVSRLERKRARNRDALVAAARHLFTRDGFEATTIANISEEADLGFGTFYRYFADKEDALRAVLEDAASEMDAVFATNDEALPAPEALALLIERFVASAGRNRGVFALWFELSMRRGSSPLPSGSGREPLPLKLGQAIHAIVMRGTTGGEFVAADATLAAHFISGGLFFVLFPGARTRTDDSATHQRLIELAFQTLGMAASPATTNTRRIR